MKKTAALVTVAVAVAVMVSGPAAAQRKADLPKKPMYVSYVNTNGDEGKLYLPSIKHILPKKDDKTGVKFCVVILAEGINAVVNEASCPVVQLQFDAWRGVDVPKMPEKAEPKDAQP